MLDDSDETGEPRVRFNQTVNVKQLSPDRTTTEPNKRQPHAFSMEKIQEEIVRLSSLPSHSATSTSHRRQNSVQHNPSSKPAHSSDKQYLYPLSNFMDDSSPLLVDDVQTARKSPPRKDTSTSKNSSLCKSASPSGITTSAFKSLASKDFMNNEDEVAEVTVQREPESRIQLDHHIWAQPVRDDGNVEVSGIFYLLSQ